MIFWPSKTWKETKQQGRKRWICEDGPCTVKDCEEAEKELGEILDLYWYEKNSLVALSHTHQPKMQKKKKTLRKANSKCSEKLYLNEVTLIVSRLCTSPSQPWFSGLQKCGGRQNGKGGKGEFVKTNSYHNHEDSLFLFCVLKLFILKICGSCFLDGAGP